MSFGKTGMISPIARMSSVTVTSMNVTAALLALTRLIFSEHGVHRKVETGSVNCGMAVRRVLLIEVEFGKRGF